LKVIFITIAYPRSLAESNLYSDLMDEFAEHGHQVTIVCAAEKRYGQKTGLVESNGIKILRVLTGNLTSNPGNISKGLALLQLQTRFIHAIGRYFREVSFDLIIYSTPPVQYNRIIRYLKRRSAAETYLLLKDIFPQNAVDIGLLSKLNPIYWYFRHQEKITYAISDRIGCMSPANVRHLLKHNPSIPAGKVGVCANSLKDRGYPGEQERIAIRNGIRKSLTLREDALLLTYGGNLGVAQGLSFLLEIIRACSRYQNVRFLIVGEGTWFGRLEKFVHDGNYGNVVILKRVSPEEFKNMLIASDIGLVFLNPKFTIPNFPSRLTSYLEAGLPVIACTDTASDLGDIVAEAGCGFKVISGDIHSFQNIIDLLISEPARLTVFGQNSRKLFLSDFTSLISYNSIVQHMPLPGE
jgi:glycosyltransferase involved in cell wall biosynthesis